MPRNNVECPNPLFLLWLEEWKNEAEKHGLNSKWIYIKAMSSIKKYPLPLRSGKECKILENIGDGIANRLDERLKQYLDDGGDPVYLHKVAKVSKLGRNDSKVSNYKKYNKVEAIVESDGNSKDVISSSKYIPKYRSGPYALLLTLFQESKGPSSIGSMNKNDLLREAQPLCDKSFTVPDPGSHYTAWSSMGTLTKKGFVMKRSSPAQYVITESGCELAQRLLQGSDQLSDGLKNLKHSLEGNKENSLNQSEKINLPEDENIPEVDNLLAKIRKNDYEMSKSNYSVTTMMTTTTSATTTTTTTGTDSEHKLGLPHNKDNIHNHLDLMSTSDTSSINTLHTKGKDFTYYYVTDSNKLTLAKSAARVNIDEGLGLCFLIKARKCDLDASGKSFKSDVTCKRELEAGFVYAYLADKDCEETSRPPNPTSSSGLSELVGSTSVGGSEKASKNLASKTTKSGSISKYLPKIKNKTTEVSNISTTSTITRTLTTGGTSSTFTSLKRTSDASINEKEKKVSKLNPSSEVKMQICDNPSNLSSTSRVDPSNLSSSSKLDPLFTLAPGSFEIILCVDTTETSGTGKHKKDLAGKLYTSNINTDTRKLQLGDFLWIAKEKNGEKRELVLDSIIERKRMDDLASSIVDGRFREQKFRLKSCALKNPIYLVEKYGSAEHLPVPEKTLRQAITNTQVIDNFFIKETADIYDSANYLTLMTSLLSNLYSSKTLYATTMDKVKEIKMDKSHESLIQEDIQYLMTFKEFSDETQKNKVLTVREIFAKQLMQVKGITTEKALAITEIYPTPLSLVIAYDLLTSRSEKEKLLTDISIGNGKRKIGDMLSRHVYILYSKLNDS